MSTLEVRVFSASWHPRPSRTSIGSESVHFDATEGQWIALVGPNGVGKSTTIAGVSGIAPFCRGELLIDGHSIDLGDPMSRFRAGVVLVPQSPSLPDARLTFQHAVELAWAQRSGIVQMAASQDLEAQMTQFGWISGAVLTPRMFDLAVAVLSMPRLLILDEILPGFPPGLQSASRYSEIKALLPWTTCLFVDHDGGNVRKHADLVVLLRDGEPAQRLAADDAMLTTVLGATPEPRPLNAGATELPARLVHPEQSPREQVKLALRARGAPRRVARAQLLALFADFPFLASRAPAAELSGGQRTILAFALIELGLRYRIPEELVLHLDATNRAHVRRWRQRMA